MPEAPSSLTEPPASTTEIAIGRREHIFHLLAEAAEVEHTLMCSYLFAAFSLRTSNPKFAKVEADAVNRWRKIIVGIATEEMVHLLLVANLTVALGGRPHFGRPNFPVSAGYFPSDVAARLTPFSAETLDHFIFLERPEDAPDVEAEGFASGTPYERAEAYHGLMPSIQDYTTVGGLYEALKVNLRSRAEVIGERGLFIGPPEAQISAAVIDLPGVRTIPDLATAMIAIDHIVEEGEGSRSGNVRSHYTRFKAIQMEFAALCESNPAFEPAWPVVENPVMRRPPEPENKVFVDNLQAAQVLDFANAVYGQLLRFLVQAFGCQGQNAVEHQKRYMDAAIALMQVLAKAGSGLASMPATGDPQIGHAGLTFTMLRSLDPIFSGQAGERLNTERLRELEEGARIAARHCPGLVGVDREIRDASLRFEQRISD